jgi:hypothetical protein
MVPIVAFSMLLQLFLIMTYISEITAVWTEFELVRPWAGGWGSNGTTSWTKISATSGNGPNTIGVNSQFGFSMANIGDLNQDGVADLVVGAPGEDNSYQIPNKWNNGTITDIQRRSGAVYIIFMQTDGSALNTVRISGLAGGGPKLYKDEAFGFSVASIGDLDGDGIPDIAVGAPGELLSAVYILNMKRDGNCKGSTMIRGFYEGTKPQQIVNGSYPVNSYTPNGPKLRFLSRFGLSVQGISDWDQDGVKDIAVSSIAADGGNGLIYFLYMYNNGTVKSYSMIGSDAQGVNHGGAPKFPGRTFTGFGSSLLIMQDMDGDGVNEFAIGTKDLDDGDTTHYRSGVIFICFMNRQGAVKKYSRISELQEQYNRGPKYPKPNKKNLFYPGGPLPMVTGDQCGASITSIGDINLDDMRQQHPTERHPEADNLVEYPDRRPLEDLVVGCPQSSTGILPGRLFFMFLSSTGTMSGFTEIPSKKDVERGIFPNYDKDARLGQSLAALQDYDKNGLKEIAVGAPGSLDSGADSGAIYVLYFRRRRWTPFWTDTRAYWVAIILPPSLVMFGIIVSIIYFFYHFRREPDEIEILVLKSGVKIEKKNKKNKKRNVEEAKVFVDDADDF